MNTIQAVVSNGKIEITVPSEIRDGETVSVLVIGHSAAEVAMSDEEVARTLKAMDEFNAAFPVQESGEDLSQVARTAGDLEKKAFAETAGTVPRVFVFLTTEHTEHTEINPPTVMSCFRVFACVPWFHSVKLQEGRASRQTEVQREFPLHVVCSWLCNSPRIAQQSYLLVTVNDFARAAGVAKVMVST